VSYTRGSDLSGSPEGAGGIGGLLARSDGYSSGNWTSHNYYHADENANITYMVNSSQSMVATYRYDPFGNPISLSGSLAGANVYRFSSKEIHVKSGMYYYGYRWYDPNLQRWLRPCAKISSEYSWERECNSTRGEAGVSRDQVHPFDLGRSSRPWDSVWYSKRSGQLIRFRFV